MPIVYAAYMFRYRQIQLLGICDKIESFENRVVLTAVTTQVFTRHKQHVQMQVRSHSLVHERQPHRVVLRVVTRDLKLS